MGDHSTPATQWGRARDATAHSARVTCAYTKALGYSMPICNLSLLEAGFAGFYPGV